MERPLLNLIIPVVTRDSKMQKSPWQDLCNCFYCDKKSEPSKLVHMNKMIERRIADFQDVHGKLPIVNHDLLRGVY